MFRFLLALWLSCFVAFAPAQARAFEKSCVEQCPDDDSSGQCAADCADCACCVHSGVMLSAEPVKPVPATAALAVAERLPSVPTSPEPGEILHVPKHTRA